MATAKPNEGASERYHSYLLRLWRADTVDRLWRASLEDPHTGERIGFASLEQLFAFLMGLVEGETKGGTRE